MRIDTLTYNNVHTQGAQRRAWLRQYSPRHLEQSAALMHHALQLRPASTSRSTLVLGAGACTEIPLADLARGSDEVVLTDLDLASMQQGREELPFPILRKRVRLLQCDISGDVSINLKRLIEQQPWEKLISQGARAVFDAAAHCLEQCPVPDPPAIAGLGTGEFGGVISSLLLTQLFSYPLLDMLDHIQRIAPTMLGEQERHHRYQNAAQAFRIRVIGAHLHLLRELLDTGGNAVLLTDIRGFAFEHDIEQRRSIPLVPRALPELVREKFTLLEEEHWEWLSDLPGAGRLGRGYEVVGYLLKANE
ncbi:MAG TPA: hypothetical protein VJ761_04765 [Ktedonobacteraceae bacterium]|nr:hypothetical protein [Ktedonobacteraceae bacterium]